MRHITTYQKRKVLLFTAAILVFAFALSIRLVYLMVFASEHYSAQAREVQQRERRIKAARGEILDRTGTVIATNETVCTISVIYNQVTDREKVIAVLTKELGMDEAAVRKKVEKRSSREKIKSNVPKEIGDTIRAYHLPGVKVDEDYIRYYPYGRLASKVLGFTGADNQGILGLEVAYESYLKGTDGRILTYTDAKGVEREELAESRVESVAGQTLQLTLDYNIQKYAEQLAYRTLEAKEANYVSIIVMNPKDGAIYAMVNAPEFDLNEPFTLLSGDETAVDAAEKQKLLNQMWRNQCISDTYEPGSTFKIVTATAGLGTGAVTFETPFSCPGFRMVEDRRIRCHKTVGHGAETFLQGLENSCNPVFIDVGARVGVEAFYQYMEALGLREKTGIDVPGEANSIVHKMEKVGPVELATMSFGQSFQITPMQLLRAVSAVINGGTLVTPHFAAGVWNSEKTDYTAFEYASVPGAIDAKVSEQMRFGLEKVVSEGGGSKGQVEGYQVGGKTATSQKLPRGSGKYIASYIGFAPANDPEVIAIAIIDEPQGMYYGGQIAAPVIQELYETVLPYLKIQKEKTDSE